MNSSSSVNKRKTQSAFKPATPRGWLDDYSLIYERDPDYVAEGLALRIAEQAVRLMKEKGISRSQLASLMGVSKAYVTKILNAPPNLTLRTIAALALALGAVPYAGFESSEL